MKTTQPATRKIPHKLRKSISRCVKKRGIRDHLEYRQTVKRLIERYQSDGKVGFGYFGMDCDCVEVRGVETIPASVMDFIIRENRMYDSAEGPCSAYVEPPEQYQSTRDRIMEAHENGHPHSV